MHDFLRLKFQADTDGTGELFADVKSEGFAGKGSAWFNTSHLLDFALRLGSTYPIRKEDPLALAGGTWKRASEQPELEHVYLRISVFPIDMLGHLGARISLASPIYENQPLESRSHVAVEIQTDYASIGRFAQALDGVIRGDLSEAVLDAGG